MKPAPTSELAAAIGKELRILRRTHGLTLRDAASHITRVTGIPVSVTTLCRWELGHKLALAQLIAICQAYGTYTPHLIDAALRCAMPDHWDACRAYPLTC